MVSLIALAGVALAVDGGSLKVTSGGTSAATGGAPAAPGSSTASQVNQPPNSSKADGKVASAAQAAKSGGALSLPANMQSRVIAWQDGPGGKHLAAVTRLFGNALQAGGARQYWQMRSACIQLTRSVSTAEAGPQIPVAAMQMLYGKALAELAKGAADCQAAIAVKPTGDDETVGFVVNATKRQQAASELAARRQGHLPLHSGDRDRPPPVPLTYPGNRLWTTRHASPGRRRHARPRTFPPPEWHPATSVNSRSWTANASPTGAYVGPSVITGNN